MYALPLRNPRVRSDSEGRGAWRAKRKTLLHRGVDLVVLPGAEVRAPEAGRVTSLNRCYSDDETLRLVEITGAVHRHRLLYVTPVVELDDDVERGQVVGVANDVRVYYGATGKMQPHIHWEVALVDFLVGRGKRPPVQMGPIWIDPLEHAAI